MEIISLGILLKDREYAEALARAIAASEKGIFAYGPRQGPIT